MDFSKDHYIRFLEWKNKYYQRRMQFTDQVDVNFLLRTLILLQAYFNFILTSRSYKIGSFFVQIIHHL